MPCHCWGIVKVVAPKLTGVLIFDPNLSLYWLHRRKQQRITDSSMTIRSNFIHIRCNFRLPVRFCCMYAFHGLFDNVGIYCLLPQRLRVCVDTTDTISSLATAMTASSRCEVRVARDDDVPNAKVGNAKSLPFLNREFSLACQCFC